MLLTAESSRLCGISISTSSGRLCCLGLCRNALQVSGAHGVPVWSERGLCLALGNWWQKDQAQGDVKASLASMSSYSLLQLWRDPAL